MQDRFKLFGYSHRCFFRNPLSIKWVSSGGLLLTDRYSVVNFFDVSTTEGLAVSICLPLWQEWAGWKFV